MTSVAELERPLPPGTTDAVMRRAFPEPNPYANDPDGWARERLGIESWSKPREIRQSVVENRHTAVPACHDSAKTHTAATIACWWLDSHPVGEAFVVSTAPRQHQVNAILWREIRSMHRRGSLPGRVTLDARWMMGNDELVAFGRKTADESDPAQAMQAFQGIHARYVLVIIDEAGGVPKWLFDAADALATNENARVIAIGNPDDPASHFHEICEAPNSKWHVIPISAFDTPAFTGEQVSESLLELLISETYVREMRALGEDSHLYQAKVLGRFPDISSDALFPPAFLNRAIAADLPGIAQGGYGVDVARFGEDETCVYRNRAGVIRLTSSVRKQDTEDVADLVDEILARHGADRVPALVDAVGVGAGVFDKLRRRGLPVNDFNGGERALQPDRYVNRRAEAFWELRQAMADGLVDLDPNDTELITQLGRIKWRPVHGGKVQIESKDDMRKRGVKSPDRADAAAMAFACPSAIPFSNVAAAAAAGESLTSDLLERRL